MPRILVTGAAGFVGQAMAGLIGAGGLPEWSLVPFAELDIRDGGAVAGAVAEAVGSPGFDSVLHLAAQTHVPTAFAQPRETLEINLLGTLNLLTALRAAGFSGRILYVSSGDVYGVVPEQAMPIDETLAPRPRNPYAVSKLAAEALACQFAFSDGLDVVVARPFNHIGPGQSARFAVASLAQQVAEIALGRRPAVVEAGNLDARRDFTDVTDVLRAYVALLERGTRGEIYNVCSGASHSLREVLALLLEIAGVTAEVRRDESLVRATEQMDVRASNAKLARDTAWKPVRPLRQTLEEVLSDWKRHHA